jgi:flagellar biosynthesis GTPase FlhF
MLLTLITSFGPTYLNWHSTEDNTYYYIMLTIITAGYMVLSYYINLNILFIATIDLLLLSILPQYFRGQAHAKKVRFKFTPSQEHKLSKKQQSPAHTQQQQQQQKQQQQVPAHLQQQKQQQQAPAHQQEQPQQVPAHLNRPPIEQNWNYENESSDTSSNSPIEIETASHCSTHKAGIDIESECFD